jgi:hypothetical protein
VDAVLQALRSYADGRGLTIDRDAPETETEGTEVRETFWDPTSGLNASVTVTRRSGRLLSVRLSTAPCIRNERRQRIDPGLEGAGRS